MSPDQLTALLADIEVDLRKGSDVGKRLSCACVDVLDVSGAGIMLMNGGQHYGTLGVSDDISSTIEDLQFTTGEGPCVDAFQFLRPVHEPDLREPATLRWPAFSGPAVEAGVRAIFAFPLRTATACLGALDLYIDQPGPLGADRNSDAQVLTEVISATVVTMHLEGFEPTAPLPIDHRAVVHQASGMVSVQLGISVDEALLRLRAQAYRSSRPVNDVARDIVDRRLRLD